MTDTTDDTKHAGGRPRIYDPEIHPKLAWEYINSCQDKNTRRVTGDGPKGTTWQVGKKVNLPTIAGMALHLGVHKDTVSVWAGEFEEFSEPFSALLHKQEQLLLNNGLSGDYNPTIAKLILSSNHGYSDRQKQEHTGSVTVSFDKQDAEL